MAEPRVFISHSMGGTHRADPRSVEIKKCIIEKLKSDGWNVFHDSIIEPGEPWRRKIIDELVKANAGIILFTDSAMESHWVTAETLILCFRKSLNPNFRVCPIFLEGKLRTDHYFNRYAPFQLMESQGLVDKEEKSPEDVAKEIAQSLESCKFQEPPTSAWVTYMDILLRNLNEGDLENAARRMGIDPEELDIIGDSNQQKICLCRDISEFMHHKDPLDYTHAIHLLLGKLIEYGNEKHPIALRNYLIAKWVENIVVECILNAFYNPEKNRILAVNTHKKEITDIYERRAEIEVSNEGRVKVLSVGDANGEVDEAILYAIDEAIRKSIVPNPRKKDGKELTLPEAVAEQMKNPGSFAICTLPENLAKEQILVELCQKYKDSKIIFLVHVGDDEKNLERFTHIEGVPLRPPLDSDKIDKLHNLKNELT